MKIPCIVGNVMNEPCTVFIANARPVAIVLPFSPLPMRNVLNENTSNKGILTWINSCKWINTKPKLRTGPRPLAPRTICICAVTNVTVSHAVTNKPRQSTRVWRGCPSWTECGAVLTANSSLTNVLQVQLWSVACQQSPVQWECHPDYREKNKYPSPWPRTNS